MALRWMLQLLLVLLTSSGDRMIQAQLTVTSLPSSFYGSSNSVVEGSVIWLYCEVNSTSNSLSVTWNKDGGLLVQDVPHIRLRTSTSSSSTTLLLVIDNVESSDAGLYQCNGQDGTGTGTGDTFNMTVITNDPGVLRVVMNDPLTIGTNFNRTRANNGDSISLSFTAGHVGDDTTMYTPPTAQWFKDGVPLTTSSTDVTVGTNGRLSSTLSFTFQESDAGVYQCIFTDSNSQIFGAIPLRIDTVITIDPGVLRIVTNDPLTCGLNFNRSRASSISLSFTAGHVGDDTTMYNPPTAQWFKDEVPLTTSSTDVTVSNNGRLSSTFSFTSQESDAGVYQCIFTDSNSQIFGAIPFRIDTGTATAPMRISPQIVFVPLSGKLVLEVAASGTYQTIFWNRNRITIGTSAAPASISEFVHFSEIFVREPVTAIDYGQYDIQYRGSRSFTDVQVVPTEHPNTTVTSDMQVSVLEGGSMDISCTSAGGPIPSITWTINSQITTFTQTDVSTNPVIDDCTNPVMTTLGYTVSTLHIVNAQYPTHNRIYTCTGTNTISGSVQNSSATISVEVQVSPEVQVSANIERVAVGDNVILNCSVITGNPTSFTFQWFHEGVSLTITSSMDSSNTLNYSSIRANELGLYTCSVSNGIGSPGTSSINITLGDPASITSPINNVTLEADFGLQLTLTCNATGVPATDITWLPSPELSPTSATVVDSEGFFITSSNLDIASVQLTDTEYSCTASNSGGTQTRFYSIIVNYPTSVVTSPNNAQALSGLSLSLICTFEGRPAPTVVWIRSRDGIETIFSMISTIESGRTFNISSSSSSSTTTSVFTISSSLVIDSASYLCMATNRLGSENSSVSTVSVYEPPVIVSPMASHDFTTNEGTDINFICMATGSPAPSISFIYEGQALTRIDGRPMNTAGLTIMDRVSLASESVNRNLSTGLYEVTRLLTLFNPTEGDSVTFMCNALSTIPVFGESTASVPFNLLVYLRPSVSLSTGHNETVELQDGNNLTLSVNITRFNLPLTSITWSHSGDILTDGMDRVTITTSPSLNTPSVISTLQRGSLIPVDFGSYTIITTNDVGSANFTFSVIVPGELFQLVFQIGTSCNAWINDNPHEKCQDITAHITSVLIEQCQCNVDSTNAISSGGFQCFTDSPQLVTYRSQIQGASDVAARDLIQILQLWLLTGPSINVRAQILNVKTSCPVRINSLSEPGCGSLTVSPTTDVFITSSEVNLMTVIIIVVVVFGIIISFVAVLAVIIILRLKAKGSAKKISSPNISSEINLQNFQRHPSEFLPAQSNDIHEYDTIENVAISQQSTIENQGVSKEEFAFTQCEAYATHRVPGRRNGPANASNTHEKAYEVVDITGNQVERREMNQSYENIRQNIGGRNVELAYESIQDNK